LAAQLFLALFNKKRLTACRNKHDAKHPALEKRGCLAGKNGLIL
jgi:hypothetical protein